MMRLLLGLLALLLLAAPAEAQLFKYNLAPQTYIDGQFVYPAVDLNGRQMVVPGGAYGAAQVPLIAGSGNVANAAATATLTGTASTTVYIAGFEMGGGGSTAGLPVTCTVAGLLGGTKSFTFNFAAGVLVGDAPLQVEFVPALPAAAVNTAIVASCPAGGAGNTNATMVAHGYYQ